MVSTGILRHASPTAFNLPPPPAPASGRHTTHTRASRARHCSPPLRLPQQRRPPPPVKRARMGHARTMGERDAPAAPPRLSPAPMPLHPTAGGPRLHLDRTRPNAVVCRMRLPPPVDFFFVERGEHHDRGPAAAAAPLIGGRPHTPHCRRRRPEAAAARRPGSGGRGRRRRTDRRPPRASVATAAAATSLLPHHRPH